MAYGTVAFELHARSLAFAKNRRGFMKDAASVVGASVLGLVGLQTAIPMRALGAGYCEFCGPTETCASQGYSGCCGASACTASCPTLYSWLACTIWNSKYRCYDCDHSGAGYCVCAYYLGSCNHGAEC